MGINYKLTNSQFALATSQTTVSLSTTANTTLVAPVSSPYTTYIRNIMATNSDSTLNQITILMGSKTSITTDLAADGGGFVKSYGEKYWQMDSATALTATLKAAGRVNVDLDFFFGLVK